MRVCRRPDTRADNDVADRDRNANYFSRAEHGPYDFIATFGRSHESLLER